MVELKSEKLDDRLVKFYAVDENGDKYYIKQVQTGIEYIEAVDLIENPNGYTYEITDKKEQENGEQSIDNQQESTIE